jgi:hypothetical protein
MAQSTSVPPPMPADATPSSESRTGSVGATSDRFARADHQHPRLTSATIVTLDGSGLATATFTRSFPVEPSVDLTPIAPGGTQPVALQVDSWVMTGPDYTGCIVRGYRGAPTTLAAVSVVGISVAVGSQTVNPFSGSASGVRVSVIALQNSAV